MKKMRFMCWIIVFSLFVQAFAFSNASSVFANETSSTSSEQLPRIVGDIQPDLGAGNEWSPSESNAFLVDPDGDSIYTYTHVVPKGKHEFKIVLGNNWNAPSYPSNNFVLNVLKDTKITFFYNHISHEVYTNYDPGVPDGSVTGGELYHNTWDPVYRSPFGAITQDSKVKLRFHTKKGDLTQVKVLLRNYNSGKTQMVNMDSAGWIEKNGKQIEYWEATIQPKEIGVYGYKFIARDGNAVLEYGEDNKQGHVGAAVEKNANLFQLTVYQKNFHTPDWMKEAVVYQIFPDRFHNGNKANDTAKEHARGKEPIEHRSWSQLPDNPRQAETPGYDGDAIWSNDFFGGDIKGIHDKLDYIQSLGVNTLYLNPIATAASNHKYDATDYKSLDPMFGTPQEFQAFVKELKKRKMHLILDGVFNHVGDDSIYFDRYEKYKTVGAYEYWSRVYDLVNAGTKEAEAQKKVEAELKAEGQEFSPYGFHNWFNIENKKEKGVYKYQAWWGFDSLPEIKSIPGTAVNYPSELNNRLFTNYIMLEKDSVAKSWLNRGANGWRLDVANEVDPEFWRVFRKELKKDTKNEPLILGEIWDDASKYFLGDLYDSVMNYRFRDALIHYLKNSNASEATEQLKAVQEDYPLEASQALMNLMGSHDTARAVYLLGNGTDSFERAELDKNYQHELGIKRLKLASIIQMGYLGAPTIYYGDEAGVTGSKDPDDRRVYPWGKEDKDLIKHYQAIGKVRSNYKQLFAYSQLHHIYGKDSILAYARTNEKQAALILTNSANEAKTVEIDVKDLIVNNIRFTDQLNLGYKAITQNGKIKITIPAMSGRMLVTDHGQNLKRPATVFHLKATEGNHSATLSWSGNAKTYHIYQSTIQGGDYTKVATTKEQTITISNLNNGRNYYFAVTAVDRYGNESSKVPIKKAIVPHVALTSSNTKLQNITQLMNSTVDLSKRLSVSGEISVQGITNDGQAEGLIAQLEVKLASASQWDVYPTTYTKQNGTFNIFTGNFLPYEPGDYQYRLSFSSDRGRSWYSSEVKTVSFSYGDDTTLPANKVELAEPKQESGQVNLSWKLEGANDPYLITILRNGKVVAELKDIAQTTYKDLDVSNGTAYQYQVKVYDQAGNATTSNTITVTPELVTVKVTFKVNAPAYTPQDVKITMPGSANGWNTGAWELSRNGAVTNDFEFTTEAQEGETLTYKYVKGGSWDQEALPDHTPDNPNDDDVSYYGYGAMGTDMQIVVTNQGGNQMIVQDKILRWIDQPVVITSHSDGQTVSSETITLKGNAIKEGILTINGQKVPIQPDMTFSHTINLQNRENKLNIHIEPSEENKSKIFKNDGGAIAKNTKNLVFTILKN